MKIDKEQLLSRYVKRILSANVYEVAEETPVDEMRFLSESLKNRVLVKREDLQPIFSFKIRGAFNKISKLTESEKKRGVIAASAGNHAQGVALAATRMGVESTIIMPTTTPAIKIDNVKARGGKVILHGDRFDESCEYAMRVAEKKGYVFIHPYDDPEVIAGQGTIGMEMLRQCPGRLDVIFVPVGGGGLISGVGAYVKYLRPEVKVMGVEAESSACLKAAFDVGKRKRLKEVGIFADGVAVAQIGKETFKVCRQCVDGVVTVNEDEICAAVKDLFSDTRSIAEPAGALALAGLKKYVETEKVKGQTLLTVESGANVNFDRLRYIAERTEVGEKREIFLAVTIPERPNSFKVFCEALSNHSITGFNYRYHDKKDAQFLVGIDVGNEPRDYRARLVHDLKSAGYPVVDMTDNEVARNHISRLIGGRAECCGEEVFYRLDFPERSGALLKFLDKLNGRWNISLFNYRKQGGYFGRAFIGFQVSSGGRKAISLMLKELGYSFQDETENPACRLFLHSSGSIQGSEEE